MVQGHTLPAFLAASLLVVGCQCLSTPGATGPVAPLVPGMPSLEAPATAAAPPLPPVEVPAVAIVPGAVSLGGGVPALLEPGLSALPDPEPETAMRRRPRPRPRTAAPRTAAPRTAAPPPRQGLSAAQIRRVVAGAAGRIRRCYEPRLENDPNLRGRVTISLDVAADGSVTSAAVRSAFDVEIGGCVSSIVSELRFPEDPQGGSAIVPFDFAPPGEAANPPPPPGNPNQL